MTREAARDAVIGRLVVAKDSPLPVSQAFMAEIANVIKQGRVKGEATTEYTEEIFDAPVEMKYVSAFGSRCSPAHQKRKANAADFYIPVGTLVYAPADGVIVAMWDGSDKSGPTANYWDEGNFIKIWCPATNEYILLEHLQQGFANRLGLKEGRAVHRGEHIGFSGNTGFTEKPHLHMEVQRFIGDPSSKESVDDDSNYLTLRIRFNNRDIPFDLYVVEQMEREQIKRLLRRGSPRRALAAEHRKV